MHEKIRVLINPTYQTRARTSSRFLNIDQRLSPTSAYDICSTFS